MIVSVPTTLNASATPTILFYLLDSPGVISTVYEDGQNESRMTFKTLKPNKLDVTGTTIIQGVTLYDSDTI